MSNRSIDPEKLRALKLQQAAKLHLARNNFQDFTRFTFPRLIENWHHTLLLNELDKALKFQQGNQHLIVVTPPRHGKALALGTPILTPDRGFVPIESLEPGDWVFGSKGTPIRVLARSLVWKNRPVYRVSVNRGQDEIIADENHEWVIEATLGNDTYPQIFQTKTLAKRPFAWKVPGEASHFITVSDPHIADTVCIQVDAEDHLFLAGKSLVPTHNSELVSRRAPAFALGRYPELEIIQATYSEDLASKMGRDVLKIIDDPKYKEVFPNFAYGEKRTHIEISTDKGGTCKFVGVGGGVTGRGANIVIIDDPFKSREEADSKSVRNRVWDWFQDDLMTRLEYPYCVIVTHTRWHLDDLAGRLLTREPEKWKLIHLPLIADYYDYGDDWPAYDPRKTGDVLWPGVRHKGRIDVPGSKPPPEEETAAQIKREYATKLSSNPYGTLSLDQGRPIHKEGNLMRRSWFGTYSSEPHIMAKYCRSIVISVDSNFKRDATDGSHVAIVVMGLRKDNSMVVLDAYWERMGFVQTRAACDRMAKKWPGASFLIESKANGDALIDTLSGLSASVVPFDPKNESKESRAHKLADIAEAGGIFLPDSEPWTERLLNILTTFPNGDLDDPVDAMSQCVIRWDKRTSALRHLRRVVGKKDPADL